tara:strand:+ start:148 stop:444 length:297 start_codon:yes stop_codon:yes gene_type:complete
MSQEITTDYALKAQEEAELAYEKVIENFYYSMLEVVFLRIKSHLNQTGLDKVLKIDEKRRKNKNVQDEFSQKIWEVLGDSWVQAEGLAMTKIAELYGL